MNNYSRLWIWERRQADAVSVSADVFYYNRCPHLTIRLLHDQLRSDRKPLRSFSGAIPAAMAQHKTLISKETYVYLRWQEPSGQPSPCFLYACDVAFIVGSIRTFIIFRHSLSWLFNYDNSWTTVIGFGSESVCKRTQFQVLQMSFIIIVAHTWP